MSSRSRSRRSRPARPSSEALAFLRSAWPAAEIAALTARDRALRPLRLAARRPASPAGQRAAARREPPARGARLARGPEDPARRRSRAGPVGAADDPRGDHRPLRRALRRYSLAVNNARRAPGRARLVPRPWAARLSAGVVQIAFPAAFRGNRNRRDFNRSQDAGVDRPVVPPPADR